MGGEEENDWLVGAWRGRGDAETRERSSARV